ncbi:MAG: hypothetical protein KDA44_02565 [Planctomycetales bacterium]|nr:hypothetical protein [Planctomycetales bacterium]
MAVRRRVVFVSLTLGLFVACRQPETSVPDGNAVHEFPVVVTFETAESLENLQDANLPGIEVADVRAALPGVESVFELQIQTRLSRAAALERLSHTPGVGSARPVREHRYSVLVEFGEPLSVTEAEHRLASLAPLLVRSPGGRDRSSYFEAVFETDAAATALLPRLSALPGVELAELNQQYQQE